MGIVDLVFPKKCFGCGKEGFYICSQCKRNLKVRKEICPICLRFSFKGKTHLRCKKEDSLDGLITIWAYEGAIRKAILALKYKFALDIAEEIAELACFEIKNRKGLPKGGYLLPVPLSRQRENWRGFNQVGEIAKILAEKMNYKYTPDLIVRKVSGTPQVALKRVERIKAVKGVFCLNSSCQIDLLRKPIILFDDVWTTGSTLKEAGNVLKKGGYSLVWGLTLAR
jgi:ComF family protein